MATAEQIATALTAIVNRLADSDALDALHREEKLFDRDYANKVDPPGQTPLTNAQRLSVVSQLRTALAGIIP